MKTLFRVASLVTLVAAVTSCNLLKKKAAEDAGVEEAGPTAEAVVDAAPPPPAAPIAANVDDIARFPDEAKLENVAGSTLRWSQAREAPTVGKVVAQLKSGTAVTKVAQRDKFFLVTFDDPKEASKKLLGWLHQDAFSPPADAGLKPITCAAPEIPLLGDTPFCGQACAHDTDCPSGKACKGSAQKFIGGKVGENVQVCTVFATVVDAGAPKPPDAGAPPVVVVDAGHPPDAAAPPPPTGAGDIVDPGGKPCSAGFVMVQKDKKCHRLCPTGLAPKDCAGGAPYCGKCDGNKVCNAVRDFCK
jgi:hypothetical protein